MPLKNASALALPPAPRAWNFFISQPRNAMRLLRWVGSTSAHRARARWRSLVPLVRRLLASQKQRLDVHGSSPCTGPKGLRGVCDDAL